MNRAMHFCNPPVSSCFLAGNREKNDVAVVAFKNVFTSTEQQDGIMHAQARGR